MSGSSSTTLVGGGEIFGPVQDRWHLYRVQVQGDVIRVSVDGEPRFEYRDTASPYLRGGIGVRVLNATLRTDDLVVDDCSGTTVDTPPPGPTLRNLRSYPNPFNPLTTASFDLGRPSPTSVAIFDAKGRIVRRLFGGTLPAGSHHMMWDGHDETGHPVASGIYYLRVRAEERTETRSLVLLK